MSTPPRTVGYGLTIHTKTSRSAVVRKYTSWPGRSQPLGLASVPERPNGADIPSGVWLPQLVCPRLGPGVDHYGSLRDCDAFEIRLFVRASSGRACGMMGRSATGGFELVSSRYDRKP